MILNEYVNKSTRSEIDLFDGYSDDLLLFASVTCLTFMIIGVPGNLLTIIALANIKQARNSTAIFIINLSLSDLLFDCFNLPLAASTFWRRSWSHGDLLCRLFPLLRYGLLAVSLFTVSLITINRYIIIAHPRHYPRIYQRRYLGIMVAGTWITSFSIMIPTWRGVWGKFGLDTEIGSCSILPDDNDRSPKEFLFITAFVVPCLCIVFCYARIFYMVRKAALRSRDAPVKNSFLQAKTIATKSDKLVTVQNQKLLEETVKKVESAPPTPQEPIPLGAFASLDDIKYIDCDSTTDSPVLGQNRNISQINYKPENVVPSAEDVSKDITMVALQGEKNYKRSNPIKTSLTRFVPRKTYHISFGNTSNASSIYPGKMSQKDRRLLKIILVIFVSFIICYLPITITKIWKSATSIHIFNITGYLLIYLTTCINPLVYVLLSSEYRQAYWNLLRCHTEKKQ